MPQSDAAARRPWFPLPQRAFVLLCIVGIILTRLGTILATPRTADFADLRIYQGVGQTVLAGVNPYDFSDQPAMRAALRARMAGPAGADGFAATQDTWNYYVSGNLPASTALYALFESVAHGSRFIWRLLLVLGDLAILLALVALLRTLHGDIANATDQAAIFCLVIVNPVLIVSGTAIPEDKQFQTALMLWSAALLLAPVAMSLRRSVSTGLILCLSILFKLFGACLFPLWLARLRREGARFALWTLASGLIPLILAYAAFGHHFFGTMLARGVQNSVAGPEHASPWTLLPWLSGNAYLISKVVVVALFCGAFVLLLARRRIDVLNLCAGLGVAFACLWLDKGAMNRMNITILFAVAAMASLSRRLFLYFSAAMVVIGAFAYALGIGVLKLHAETVDAALALLFVCAYAAAMACVRVRSAVCSSPIEEEGVSRA